MTCRCAFLLNHDVLAQPKYFSAAYGWDDLDLHLFVLQTFIIPCGILAMKAKKIYYSCIKLFTKNVLFN